MTLLEEAQKCRFDVQALADQLEAPFLLHLARAFEELAELKSQLPEAPGRLPPSLSIEGAGGSIFFREPPVDRAAYGLLNAMRGR